MKFGGLLTAVALLAVLGGLAWWTTKHPSVDTKANASASPKIIAVEPKDIEGIQITKTGSDPVVLSKKEFALLRVLASEPERVFTREEHLRTIWGYQEGGGATRTLDSHAFRLRRKLGVRGDRFVVNVWGVGFRLHDGEEQ